MWTAVFFCCMWRKWIQNNGYSEKEHFVTNNIYSCIEINGHLILSLVVSVLQGKLPKECLRIWTTGPQACGQTFHVLRSMAGTFSTMVNFTLKCIFERINKLNYISSIECTEEIIFPQGKRRLLQVNEYQTKPCLFQHWQMSRKAWPPRKLNDVQSFYQNILIIS